MALRKTTFLYARVVKLVDTRDLKSLDRKVVPVRFRSRAPINLKVKEVQAMPTVFVDAVFFASLQFRLVPRSLPSDFLGKVLGDKFDAGAFMFQSIILKM